MKKAVIAIVLSLGLMTGGGEALPLFQQGPVAQGSSYTPVKFSPAQKAAARKACRAKFGARLAYVSFSGRKYYCNYRKSTKVLTKQAAKKCRKDGLRLDKVISIRMKRNESITRFRCKR